jgi:hypothetical protein
MVSPRGHVEVRGELWAENKFDPKMLLETPEIAWSQEAIAQGHIKRGLIRKRANANYSEISQEREREGRECYYTYTKASKGHVFRYRREPLRFQRVT